MTETSKPLTFAERLRQQEAKNQTAIAAYGRRTDAMMVAAQQKAAEAGAARRNAPGEQLTLSAETALKRTESAFRDDHRSTARMLGALWLRTLAVGLALYAATWSSLWAIGR